MRNVASIAPPVQAIGFEGYADTVEIVFSGLHGPRKTTPRLARAHNARPGSGPARDAKVFLSPDCALTNYRPAPRRHRRGLRPFPKSDRKRLRELPGVEWIEADRGAPFVLRLQDPPAA